MALNKVMLIGNVGRDPDIRYTEGGICTAQFTLATTMPGYRLENGTEIPEHTEWHRIQAWRKIAEIVERYVHKGDKLYIEGQLRTRAFSDKKAVTHYITEVWVENMEILSPKNFS